jgi:hypothetical protein
MWFWKPRPKPDSRGMTTNERLFAAGLIDKFDSAARKRDRAKMIKLLSRVDLASQAETIADMIIANPSKYGH